jgi:hypothetical protein
MVNNIAQKQKEAREASFGFLPNLCANTVANKGFATSSKNTNISSATGQGFVKDIRAASMPSSVSNVNTPGLTEMQIKESEQSSMTAMLLMSNGATVKGSLGAAKKAHKNIFRVTAFNGTDASATYTRASTIGSRQKDNMNRNQM